MVNQNVNQQTRGREEKAVEMLLRIQDIGKQHIQNHYKNQTCVKKMREVNKMFVEIKQPIQKKIVFG